MFNTMSDPRLKAIKIKSGVLKRVTKEKSVYEREVETERQRLQRMRNEDKDDYDLRKQEEVIQESLMMLPESQKRIQHAFNDLNNVLQEAETELSETQEFQTAKALIQELKQIIQ